MYVFQIRKRERGGGFEGGGEGQFRGSGWSFKEAGPAGVHARPLPPLIPTVYIELKQQGKTMGRHWGSSLSIRVVLFFFFLLWLLISLFELKEWGLQTNWMAPEEIQMCFLWLEPWSVCVQSGATLGQLFRSRSTDRIADAL